MNNKNPLKMEVGGDWKCPECPYNSPSEAQLGKHMNTIAHEGITVESETVKKEVSKDSEPEQKEAEQDSDSRPPVSSKYRTGDVEADLVLKKAKKKIKAEKDKGKAQPVEKCQNCPYFSKSLKQFARHQVTHHSDNVHKCEQCGNNFTGKRVLASHVKVVHLLEGFNCTYCDIILRTTNKLNSHIKISHLAKEKKLKQSKKYERKFKIHKCEVCDYSCYNSNSLARHIESKHDSTLNPCDQCDKEFKVKQELVVHKRNVHGGGYLCIHCDFTCATGSDIKVHRRKEHPEHMFGGRSNKNVISKTEIKPEPESADCDLKEENKDFEVEEKVKLEGWNDLRSGFLEGTQIQNGVKLKQRLKLGMKIDSEVTKIHLSQIDNWSI